MVEPARLCAISSRVVEGSKLTVISARVIYRLGALCDSRGLRSPTVCYPLPIRTVHPTIMIPLADSKPHNQARRLRHLAVGDPHTVTHERPCGQDQLQRQVQGPRV